MNCQDYSALGEVVWRERLSNGLDICVIPKQAYGKQFAFFAARCGGMDTKIFSRDGGWSDIPAGVAHYLEHKLFDTEDGSVSAEFAESGASDNAFTAADMTGYYFDCTCDFEKNLKLLLNFVSNPQFTEESVQKEQGIIAQEICMDEDDPYSELYYKMMELLYAEHPIRKRIAGTTDSIAKINADLLYYCHKTFYHPGNMVLCVAGNVDPERIVQIAQEILPDPVSVTIDHEYGRGEPSGAVGKFAQWSMPVSSPLFNIGIKCEPPGKGNSLKQRFVAELACDVLFGPSSVLYNRLYDEGLINTSFGGDYECVPGAAYILISGESRNPKKVRAEILKEAERLAANGIDGTFWDRLVRAAYGAAVRRLNSLEDICIEVVQTHFDDEDYLRFPELFQSIKKEDVQKILKEWCTEERTALAIVTPQK